MITLSVIIPCYNEAKNLPGLVERIVKAQRQEIEFILVDNGSTDESPRVLKELLETRSSSSLPLIRSIRVEKNQGYGFGILSGLNAAEGKFLSWTHADHQTDPLDLLTALGMLEKSHFSEDIFVKGKRYGRPKSDVFFTMGMSVFVSIILRSRLWDVNAQPNVFAKSFFKSWTDAPYDFSLDLYAYHKARSKGLRVIRFPVKFGERAFGVSHWNINWKSKFKFIERTVKFTFALRRALSVSAAMR